LVSGIIGLKSLNLERRREQVKLCRNDPIAVVFRTGVLYSAAMIGRRTAFIFVLAGLLLGRAAFAVTTDLNPDERNYRVIIDRNPFGLKPPPPPPTNPPPVVTQPKEEVFITGITSFGVPRAHFMTTVTKPPPVGKVPQYYSLGVEEKMDELEVLDIDLGTRSVRVRNAGVETVMTFESNGIKPAPTPATPLPGAGTARPGMPPIPGAVPAPGGATASLSPGATAVTAGTRPTTRGSRVRTIPSRTVRTQPIPAAPPQPVADVEPNPDAAVQDVLIMEVQRQANPDVPFPPIPMPE
jgi:hypothetical protein